MGMLLADVCCLIERRLPARQPVLDGFPALTHPYPHPATTPPLMRADGGWDDVMHAGPSLEREGQGRTRAQELGRGGMVKHGKKRVAALAVSLAPREIGI